MIQFLDKVGNRRACSSVRLETYHMHLCNRRIPWAILKSEAPTNEDHRLSLCSKEKYIITVCFIFKEMQEIVFENVSIILGYRIFSLCLIDNLGRSPAKDLVGSKSSICSREYEERIVKKVR